jgi:NADH-quinone oxidoreductase subunit N
LGAFAVVAFLRNAMRSEQIADYAGLVRSCPMTTVCLSAILLSLVGLPPFVGFIGKFAAFAALANAGYWTLLIIGGINTVISLFYYLRVVKLMTLDPEPDSRGPIRFTSPFLEGAYVCLMAAPLLILFICWDALHRWSLAAASQLLQ